MSGDFPRSSVSLMPPPAQRAMLALTFCQGSPTRPSTTRKDGGSWIARVLHRNPSPEPVAARPSHPQPRRTLSDKAMNLMLAQRRDALRNEDLQGLVRLCGKSKLYLPADYAPGSLLLPTCFRATAQCLVQNGS